MSGRWLYRDEGMDIELELLADGTYRHELRSASGTEQTRGRYTLEKEVLHIRPDARTLPPRVPDRGGFSGDPGRRRAHLLFVRQTSPAGAHDAALRRVLLEGCPNVSGKEDRRLFEPYTGRVKAFSPLPEGWRARRVWPGSALFLMRGSPGFWRWNWISPFGAMPRDGGDHWVSPRSPWTCASRREGALPPGLPITA